MKNEKESILKNFYFFNKYMKNFFDQRTKKSKVTKTEAELIMEIKNGCDANLKLKEKRRVGKSNISQKIKSLEEKKIIKISLNKEDKRKKDIELTKKGEKIYSKIQDAKKEFIEIIFEKLSQKEIKDLEKIISKLNLK